MILYLLVITFANFLIASGVSFASGDGFFYVLGMSALATVVEIALSGLTATVCRLLPKKCADRERKIYRVSAGEKKFYEKLKIRKWKDLVPEIGHFTGFRKNKIVDPKSEEYLERFLLEIAYGELGHFFSLFTGFLVLLLFPIYAHWLPIAIAVAIVGFTLNVPPIMILRYNSYKLRVLLKSVKRKK